MGTNRRITAKKTNAVPVETINAKKWDMLNEPRAGEASTMPELKRDMTGVIKVESRISKPMRIVKARSFNLYNKKNFGVGMLNIAFRPVRKELNRADEVQISITKPTKPAVPLEFRIDCISSSIETIRLRVLSVAGRVS